MKAKSLQFLLLIFLLGILCCEKDKVDKNEPYDKNMTAIATQGNIVWVGTKGNGLYKLEGGEWINYTNSEGLLSNQISSLVIDNEGKLWIGTNIGGSKFSNDVWTRYVTSDGLVNEYVTCITEDQQNNIWILTQEGFFKYDHAEWFGYMIHNGLFNNIITAIACDHNNEIWVGPAEGLIKFPIN